MLDILSDPDSSTDMKHTIMLIIGNAAAISDDATNSFVNIGVYGIIDEIFNTEELDEEKEDLLGTTMWALSNFTANSFYSIEAFLERVDFVNRLFAFVKHGKSKTIRIHVIWAI